MRIAVPKVGDNNERSAVFILAKEKKRAIRRD